MSNKVEAATGVWAPNEFTDDDGETYEVIDALTPGMLNLLSDNEQSFFFYKADATKIIALIAEAAK